MVFGNFRHRAAPTAPCLAQCVKYSRSLVGAIRFTLTALCLAQGVKYSCILVGAIRFALTTITALCLMQCVKYSCSPVGANMCYMPFAAQRASPFHLKSSSSFLPKSPFQVKLCLVSLLTRLIKGAVSCIAERRQN